VVVGVGKGARLDAEWKPGNYHFEQARELVRKSIAKAEEAEPLFNFSARVLARELRVGWTDQDVEFLTAFAGTPLGHKMTDWLDAFIAPMLVRDWSKDPKYNPRLSERMREIGRIADQRLLTLTPELAVASRGHEAEVRRMEGLVKSFNSEAGRVIGLRIGGRSLARVMIIMRDITPELEPIVNEYKRQRGGTQI